MKKAIFLGVFSLFSFYFSSTTLAAYDANLKPGARGDAVFEAQELLVEEGCLSVNPTGYWGVLSVKAAKCFQLKYSLPSTGYWGPLTRAKANEVSAETFAGINAAEIAEVGTTNAPVEDPNIKALQTKIDALTQKVEQTVAPSPIVKPVIETPAPVIKKALKMNVCGVMSIEKTGRCDVVVFYSENYVNKDIDAITVEVSDGAFQGSSNPGRPLCTGGETIDATGVARKGNPLTCPTRQIGMDNQPGVFFQYIPSTKGTKTITASAGGVSVSSTIIVNQ